MTAHDLKARLQADDQTLTPLECCIAYAHKVSAPIADQAFAQVEKIEADKAKVIQANIALVHQIHDAQNALEKCVMMLTNANTITDESQSDLIRQLKAAGMPELADAVAIGGMASVVGGGE